MMSTRRKFPTRRRESIRTPLYSSLVSWAAFAPPSLLLNAQPNSFSAAAKKVAKLAQSSTPEPARLLPDNGSSSEPPCEIHFRDKLRQGNRPDIARYRSRDRSPTRSDWRDLQPEPFVISRGRPSELASCHSPEIEGSHPGNKCQRVRPNDQFRPAPVRAPCIPPCLESFHARFSMASFLLAHSVSSPQEFRRDLLAALGLRARSLPPPNPSPTLHRMVPP